MAAPWSYSRSVAPGPVRTLSLARGAWGVVLLAAPGRAARAVAVPETGLAVGVLRVLGGRHVAQAVLTAASPGKGAPIGVAVDTAHALSALAFAASDRRRRTAGLTSASVAAAFAVAGFLASRATRPS